MMSDLMFRELRLSFEGTTLRLLKRMWLQPIYMICEFAYTYFCGLLQSFKEFVHNPDTRWTKMVVADTKHAKAKCLMPIKFVERTLHDAAAKLTIYKILKIAIGNFRDKWEFLRFTETLHPSKKLHLNVVM